MCIFINECLSFKELKEVDKQICESVNIFLKQKIRNSYQNNYNRLNPSHSIAILNELSSVENFSEENMRSICAAFIERDIRDKLEAICISIFLLVKDNIPSGNNEKNTINDLVKLLSLILPINISRENIRDKVASLYSLVTPFPSKYSEALAKSFLSKISVDYINVEGITKIVEKLTNTCQLTQRVEDLIDNYMGQLIERMQSREDRIVAKEKVLNFLRDKLKNLINTCINFALQSDGHAELFENLKQEINKVLLGRTINRHEDRTSEALSTLFPQFFVTNTKKELEIILKKLDEISVEASKDINPNMINKI